MERLAANVVHNSICSQDTRYGEKEKKIIECCIEESAEKM